MADTQTKRSGIIKKIQALPFWQRWVIFSGTISVVIFIIIAITSYVYYQTALSVPREVPTTLQNGVTHAEYITWDAPDVYPGALAIDADGTLYTGSYGNGAIFASMAAGDQQELATTRERIGSISGLDIGADGALYVLDRVHPVQARGAIIWRYDEAGLTQVAQFSADGRDQLQLPNDIAVDDAGNIYVVDFVLKTVWRITAQGEKDTWWRLPINADQERAAPAGLAYDAENERLLITDGGQDLIYGVTLDNPSTLPQIVYRATEEDSGLGLNGITIAPDGTIYVAALGKSSVARIDDQERLTLLAQNFRGSSDVAYDAANTRLFVNNWDQSWLLPVRFLFFSFDVDPRLPFSVDVLTLQG